MSPATSLLQDVLARPRCVTARLEAAETCQRGVGGDGAPLAAGIFLIFGSLSNFRLIRCLLVLRHLGLLFVIITIIAFMIFF